MNVQPDPLLSAGNVRIIYRIGEATQSKFLDLYSIEMASFLAMTWGDDSIVLYTSPIDVLIPFIY